ncbi:hypothetical protein [Streptococcus phage PhiSdyV1524-fexAoptrA]|nr:hypothetical protein [Streptococcus phage PhiSdyV1524-fexAoptrA]
MWTDGRIDYQGQKVDYIAKVSPQPSEVGIDLGCVFKLDIEVAEEKSFLTTEDGNSILKQENVKPFLRRFCWI